MRKLFLQGQPTGVAGAGLMGAEIALVQALAGADVTLLDREEAVLEKAMARLTAILEKGISRGYYEKGNAEDALARISVTTRMEDFADCSIVTEAVAEVEAVKKAVIRSIADSTSVETMIVTNTSTIPISVLASCLDDDRQEQFVGMHYFSPVSRMKLVEIIPGLVTSAKTVLRAEMLAEQTGKTSIKVKDVPGFAVNRVLHIFMIEAVRLVEEGVLSAEDLDTACRLGLGHPMGPFELMDATTSSLCLQAQEIMFESYGERFRPRPLLKQRVAAGFVGGKGQKGWRTGG